MPSAAHAPPHAASFRAAACAFGQRCVVALSGPPHAAQQYGVSYTYHAMWAYFSRDDVALPGLAAWFAACSLEERDHGAWRPRFLRH